MLDTSYSPYWLVLFVLLGLGYASLLYSVKKTPWKASWNRALFILRTLSVMFISYLLLEPFISIQETKKEDSNIVFLWDDSKSIRKNEQDLVELFSSVVELKEFLEGEKNVSVPIIDLSGDMLTEIDSMSNDREESPLNSAIQNLSSIMDMNMISEVVLFSDGIYNKGIAPDYYAFPFLLSTVGMGDTTKQRDVVIQQIRYNKVAYEGNQFPVEVDVLQSGFAGRKAKVTVSNEGKIIKQKMLELVGKDELSTVQFLLDAKATGFQQYQIEVEPFSEEYNPENNVKYAYVNVVEGKKNILLLSPYPHPDIKALSAAIKQNDNYDFKMVVSGIDDTPIENLEDYDLVILFHLPSTANAFKMELSKLHTANIPLWFISGSDMDYRLHNKMNKSVNLRPSNEKDQAFAYFNSSFDLFELDSKQKEIQSKLPPVYMPFVEHQFHPLSKVLMMKQVGKVQTKQPVFVFYSDDETRQSTLLIQNFRIWRMAEYINTQSFTLFDEWVSKTVRYLTASNQKDRFKIFPSKDSFVDSEAVKLQVEVYNEVFDRIYGDPIKLQLKNQSDSIFRYEFTPDRVKPDIDIGNLPGGVYEYEATVKVQGKTLKASGQFAVQEFDLENQNLQADYDLLRRLAKKNGGVFYNSNLLEQLKADLLAKEYPQVLTEESERLPISKNPVPYILIFLLLFSEWFIRRYFGSY